ncbi:protein transport protein Sec31A isoform X2 [Alosa sapidissima]|uniref:protein transport protein Sec31A isoform X2 n=1 Tax=Alosa sapidissima TaxID=34773 RepID=UPI001C09566A|nr:protein transport protein Sec31A isoform X2 [Alosa sapidissima]
MKLKEINRTAIQAWSPAQQHPVYLATGTSAQQLDASFSTSASLEIFQLDLTDPTLDMKTSGTFSSPHRYHQLAWGPHGIGSDGHPSGVLIAGGENGNIILYDPAKILDGSSDVVIDQSTKHTGPVRALDVNPFQTNLFASGGNESEIYIWDLNSFSSPMTPGPKSQPLEDVSCVAWNGQVQHILASASPSGRASIWDLRKNDLIIKVSDHSNRMHCSGLAWHPEVATQLALASEDDRMPVIQMWDLRFATSPLKVLENHTRGVLAIAWSLADPELLLSCGKDNRILCWDPNTAEVLYELPTSSQWCFDIQWCPRNPALLSAAAFDGHISVYSIMGGKNDAVSLKQADQISTSFGNLDPFGTGQTLPPLQLPQAPTAPSTVTPLKKPPKWIRRPVGASFAFGGKLVSLENGNPLPQPTQQPLPRVVHVSQVVTETAFLERSGQLQATLSAGSFAEFCQTKIEAAPSEFEKAVWSFLKVNFEDDSRGKYLELLGYKKEELALKIAEALEKKDSQPAEAVSEPLAVPESQPEPEPEPEPEPQTQEPEAEPAPPEPTPDFPADSFSVFPADSFSISQPVILHQLHQPEAVPEPQTEPAVELVPPPQVEPAIPPELAAEHVPKSEVELAPETQVEPISEVEFVPEAEVMFAPGPQAEVQPELQAGLMPEPQLELVPNVQPEAHTVSGTLPPEAAAVGQPPEAAILEPLSEVALLEPPPEAATLEPLPKAAILEPSPQAAILEPLSEVALLEPPPEAATLEPLPEAAILEPSPQAAILEPLSEVALLEPPPEAVTLEPLPEAAILEQSPEAITLDPSLQPLIPLDASPAASLHLTPEAMALVDLQDFSVPTLAPPLNLQQQPVSLFAPPCEVQQALPVFAPPSDIQQSLPLFAPSPAQLLLAPADQLPPGNTGFTSPPYPSDASAVPLAAPGFGLAPMEVPAPQIDLASSVDLSFPPVAQLPVNECIPQDVQPPVLDTVPGIVSSPAPEPVPAVGILPVPEPLPVVGISPVSQLLPVVGISPVPESIPAVAVPPVPQCIPAADLSAPPPEVPVVDPSPPVPLHPVPMFTPGAPSQQLSQACDLSDRAEGAPEPRVVMQAPAPEPVVDLPGDTQEPVVPAPSEEERTLQEWEPEEEVELQLEEDMLPEPEPVAVVEPEMEEEKEEKEEEEEAADDLIEEPLEDPTEDISTGPAEPAREPEVAVEPPAPAPSVSEPVKLKVSKEVDGLITQALLTGDFESAVDLCLHDNRMADSIILAIAGGPELLERTQKKYFLKTQTKITKLISAVVMRDWLDILQTCELHSWREALAAVMTYAKPEDFSNLCGLLGSRLEQAEDLSLQAQACLCYICAGSVEKLVTCWTKAQESQCPLSLQDLVEKVVILRQAVERTHGAQASTMGTMLAQKMGQYASLLASQGSLDTALAYLPENSNQEVVERLRDRLSRALGHQAAPVTATPQAPSAHPAPTNMPTARPAAAPAYAYNQQHSAQPVPAPAPAHTAPQYYQQFRSASTVTSWSNQTPTVLPSAPRPLGPAPEPQVDPSVPPFGLQAPVSAAPPASSAPGYMHSQQYPQIFPHYNAGAAAPPALYNPLQYSSSPPSGGAAYPPSSSAPYPHHYMPSAAPYPPSPATAYPSHPHHHHPPPLPHSLPSPPAASVAPSFPSPPPVASSSFAPSSPPPLMGGSTFQQGGLGSPVSNVPPALLPPGASGTETHASGDTQVPASQRTGPQNGWNDPPNLTRGPKKKKVLDNYAPPAPITAPIMSPLGEPQPQAPTGPPQPYPQPGLQAPYAPMQHHPPQGVAPAPGPPSVPLMNLQGAPGAPTGDRIQPMQKLPAEKVSKKPIPQEHMMLKTTFEGLVQKCLAAASDPQTKRKLDVANKRLEMLYDKLREQSLSPAIVGGLHNMARSIESRAYTDGLNIHTHIVSSSNFSEISAFMPVLKVLLTEAIKLGV